jgi:coenzyme Q-binding protein COQ10
MPRHEETRLLPFTADEMFDIVADVERYPEFVPGCTELKVLRRQRKGDVENLTAAMRVSFGGFHERYTSLVTLDRGRGTIDAHETEGPFAHLDTHWRIRTRNGGSEVDFSIDFAFRSYLLSLAAGLVFDLMARRMADAFVARAEKLHGTLEQP